MRISIVLVLAIVSALVLSAVASGAEAFGPKCKEIRVAHTKSILGQSASLAQGGDFDGQRSICTISIGATEAVVIESQSAKKFRYTIGYFQRRAAIGRVKDMVPIRLGDEGYKLRFAGDGTANVLVFRVGSRMFTLSAEPRPSVTAAKRLALAKAVVTRARSK